MRRVACSLIVAGVAGRSLASLAATARIARSPPSWRTTSRSARTTTRSRRSARSSASGDADALALLQALADGEVQTAGERCCCVKDGKATDRRRPARRSTPLPESRDDVVLNNRVRRELATAIATLKLAAPDRAVRLAAAKELQSGADEAMLPAIERALAQRAGRGDQGAARR